MDLIERTRKQAQRFGAEFASGAVSAVDLSKRPFRITVAKETYVTETLIIASGASARMLGIESEKSLLGHGVSTCATCDGAFFRNREIVVVGGGDTAMEEATFLTRFASRVTLLHRRDEFRASKTGMLERARANNKIVFKTPYVIDEVENVAKNSVDSVTIRHMKTNKLEKIPTEGVFVAIGHDPNTKVFKGQIDMDDDGYILTNHGPKTSVVGVFWPRETFRTAIIAKPLPQQDRAAWLPSKRNASSPIAPTNVAQSLSPWHSHSCLHARKPRQPVSHNHQIRDSLAPLKLEYRIRTSHPPSPI